MEPLSRTLISFLLVATTAAAAGCGTVHTMPTLASSVLNEIEGMQE